jgi:ABC-type nitrate/sulfonate/bicarbonate transport system substrate-binding protein
VGTRLALGAFSPSVLLRVARRTGRLDEHGLTVDEVQVASSPAQFRSLLDGQLDAVLTSPDNALAYRFVPDNPLGVTDDVKIVSAVDRGLGLALYGSPAQPSLDRFRRGVFGVDVPTSGFAFAMYALAESVGLRRDDYEVVALGSTPKRLAALLAGRCDATMLNAGNEILAEQAGCVALARTSEVSAPYLGTVLAVVGEVKLAQVWQLATALRVTAGDICAGVVDGLTAEVAAESLGLPAPLALRYLSRLKDPREGLVRDGLVDAASLATVVNLRRRYLPSVLNGVDVLAPALEAGSSLLAPAPRSLA